MSGPELRDQLIEDYGEDRVNAAEKAGITIAPRTKPEDFNNEKRPRGHKGVRTRGNRRSRNDVLATQRSGKRRDGYPRGGHVQ
ncbi:hypothetical protein IPM62_01830 [Candidatus Woesebacteria bacterium]|nr:MAG: hypothetical protein IPM62_01830 [Candidatus Woesebacteria bacterium]